MPQHCLHSRILNVLHTCFAFMTESANGRRAVPHLSFTLAGPPTWSSRWAGLTLRWESWIFFFALLEIQRNCSQYKLQEVLNLCSSQSGLCSDLKGASEGHNHHERIGGSGRWWPVQRGPPWRSQAMPQKRVQARWAELSSYPRSIPICPGTPYSNSGQEGRRGWRAPAHLPRPVGGRGRRKTHLPESGLALAFTPVPDISQPGRPCGSFSEWENEGDEGAAVRSQGELQRHQAAAHRPITGADEEAEGHTGGGLFHGVHEAPAQVSLGLWWLPWAGKILLRYHGPFVARLCLWNQRFLPGSVAIFIVLAILVTYMSSLTWRSEHGVPLQRGEPRLPEGGWFSRPHACMLETKVKTF